MFRLICLVTFGLSGFAYSNILEYKFDSNNEGWRRGDLNTTTLVMSDLGPSTWNTGGYIDGDDFSTWAFHVSPTLTGNYSNATRIQFDYSSLSGDAIYPFVILRSSTTQVLFQSIQVPADNSWHTYKFNFTPGSWQFFGGGAPSLATQSQINSVLGSLDRIGISADNSVGIEFTRLDNVALVPEPTTVVALIIGAPLLFSKKLKKRS